ncbi:MAG: hypothetical protein CVV34_01500 [Methanomicrobiales archaeon HGW-Methanomicrobiales-5]|jgi:hypothetical protein|nr:MAG: hypothetical protein CVV34_01500 [Methanomicrobiales archaeon HGW-Methanomicrobiales-5]
METDLPIEATYKNVGLVPELKDPGRKKKLREPKFEQVILDDYQINKFGPVILEQKLKLFNSVDAFVRRYNTLKPHMSLNFDGCEPPERAFWKKLPAEVVLSYSKK